MKTISDYILGLDGQQKTIVTFLHERISNYHGLQHDISHDIPMYRRKSWVCYLNPIKNNGIELAFTKGHLLSNDQHLLHMKKRKYVAGIDLYSLSEIPVKLLDAIIQEALILDEIGKINSG